MWTDALLSSVICFYSHYQSQVLRSLALAVKKKAKANKMPAKKETSDAMSTLAAKVLANKGLQPNHK